MRGRCTLPADCGWRNEAWTVILGVRGEAEAMVDAARAAGAEASFVASPEDAGEWLVANVRAGDVVLLKASPRCTPGEGVDGYCGDTSVT